MRGGGQRKGRLRKGKDEKKKSQARKDWEVEKEQDTGKKWGMKKPAGGRKKWRPTGSAEEQDGGGSARRSLSITTGAGASPEAGRCGLRALRRPLGARR